TVAMDDCFFMLHTAYGLFWIFSGSLNTKSAVLPPSNKVVAMPDDAMANAMPFFDRISVRVIEMRNVLPLPPGVSKKKESTITEEVRTSGCSAEAISARHKEAHKIDMEEIEASLNQQDSDSPAESSDYADIGDEQLANRITKLSTKNIEKTEWHVTRDIYKSAFEEVCSFISENIIQNKNSYFLSFLESLFATSIINLDLTKSLQ
ncbi:hypothetical protein PV327_011285, partial [Microctonus hyperodae]